MRVRLLLFASLRERAGCDSEDLELQSGATLGDAIGAFLARHPKVGPLDASIRFAHNLQMADTRVRLSDGDEIAMIPPVSGG